MQSSSVSMDESSQSPTAVTRSMILARALTGLVVGAAIGAIQCAIVVDGMRRGDRAPGLDGIGVALVAAAVYLAVTLVLLFLACGLLRLRLWAFAALNALVTELLVVSFLFAHARVFGLHGHAKAALFVVSAALMMAVLTAAWPHRQVERWS